MGCGASARGAPEGKKDITRRGIEMRSKLNVLVAAAALLVAPQLAAAIRAARYVEIPDCGHCPQLEKPRELAALIIEFLG